MNFNPTPKSEFLQDAMAVKNHHNIVEDPVVRKHLNYALMEMQRRAAANTDPKDFNFCASSHLRLLGAQDFIDIFLNLAETMAPGVRTDTTNLPGNVAKMTGKN